MAAPEGSDNARPGQRPDDGGKISLGDILVTGDLAAMKQFALRPMR